MLQPQLQVVQEAMVAAALTPTIVMLLLPMNLSPHATVNAGTGMTVAETETGIGTGIEGTGTGTAETGIGTEIGTGIGTGTGTGIETETVIAGGMMTETEVLAETVITGIT